MEGGLGPKQINHISPRRVLRKNIHKKQLARLHFGGVIGQRQRHGGEALLATVDDAVVAAARMRTLADGAALHLRVLGQACVHWERGEGCVGIGC